MFKADGERRDFPVNKDTVVIGRKNTCDLRIPLSSVSRQHFQIEQQGDTLTLRDLGSSNGTYHNDERKMEVELAAGDKIRVGPVTFVVVIDGKPEDVEPVTTVLPADSGEIESPAESGLDVEVEAAAEVPAQAEPVEELEPLEEVKDVDEDQIVLPVDEESHTPTVDIDEDDPIAALEALAAAGNDDEDAIPLLDDDEDEDTK